MGSDHRKDEEAIFYAALELTSPTARAIYVKEACGSEMDLFERVRALLMVEGIEDGFLEDPPTIFDMPTPSPVLTEAPGTIISRYKLLEKIGEGGMAVVYMAEQEQPIRRKVALKVIKLGMDTRQVIARFEAERQALAMMDHPSIAKVFDAGSTVTGRPYFVMELVQGVSITEYCDRNRLGTKERLGLFIQVCNAVQHAHQKGIIHRDLKPSNVMVTCHDGKPVPKVIDFGIAKAINQKLTEKTLFTRYAHLIGTPAYMSPEQAELSDLDIDTRSDIYSLGVLLYELLTGTTPFSEEELRKAGYIEMQRVIREQEPVKPSTKISTLGDTSTEVAKRRNSTPDLLRKAIRGDLDWIVMKSLEKDRTHRYGTANALALDVQRHLASEPVLARAPSAVYRLQKFLRRNSSRVLAALLVAVLAAAGVVVLSLWSRDRRQLAQAEDIREKAILSQAHQQYAEGNRPAAIETIKSILNSRLVGPQAQLLYAGILVEGRQADEATAMLEGLIDQRPAIAGAAHALLARILWESESLDSEKLEQIDEHRHQAIARLPDAEACFLQAMTALTVKEQLALLDRALELDSGHYEARRLRAFVHRASHRYEQLSDDALGMTILRQDDPLGYSLRAMALRELGKYDAALRYYDQAIAHTPVDSPESFGLWFQYCETLLRMGDYERVVQKARECSARWPDRPVFPYRIFYALTALGEYEEAEAIFRQIVGPREEPDSRFEYLCRKYVFDSLRAGRLWHPPGRAPAGRAFAPMIKAEESYRQLSAKGRWVTTDGFNACWSPDGSKLAFSLGVHGYSGVAIYDPATGETDLLIVPGKDPRWSPDGKYIAFVRDCQVLRVPELVGAARRNQDRIATQEEVWIMNADGTEPRRLAKGSGPSWGKDSRCVYYQSRLDRAFCSISVTDTDTKPQQLFSWSGAPPSVSPDGQCVAYKEGGALKVKDLASQTVIAQWPAPFGAAGGPAWSPTGRELCLAGRDDPPGEAMGLWIYAFDANEPLRILEGQITSASWALNGTKLAFALGVPHFDIWVADLDPNVSTLGSLGPGQTAAEHWQDMMRLYTRRIETDALDAYAYFERARCYDYLHDRAKADADMRRWSAAASGRLPSDPDAPPAQMDFTFGEPLELDGIMRFFPDAGLGVSCISSDGLEMFVGSNRDGGQGIMDIWVLKRASPEENWGPPENLGPVVNSAGVELAGSISPDGLDLYFISSRPGAINNSNDLYVTRRATRTSPWGPPASLGQNVNTPYAEAGLSVSSDGLELYFASGRGGPQDMGGIDLYVSTRATTQDLWGDPVNLGPAVNSPSWEQVPFLSPDGLLLFFISDRPGGYGDYDIWMTRRASHITPWEPAVNLGPTINSPEVDLGGCLAPDGSTLYFARGWPDNPNKPCKAPIIPIMDTTPNWRVDFSEWLRPGQGQLPLDGYHANVAQFCARDRPARSVKRNSISESFRKEGGK